MKGMILAAGRGTRMAHLTQATPKPLLKINGKTLIEYRVEAFARWGIRDIVINLHYHGEQIRACLGDGARFGVSITYSFEERLLEVGGGIYHALPLLGAHPFMTINADVWTDFFPSHFSLPTGSLAHLIMVKNPSHHPQGDFSLNAGVITEQGDARGTFSGIALYHPDFFKECVPGTFPLREVLRRQIPRGCVTGEYYEGLWQDVGTPERLLGLQTI